MPPSAVYSPVKITMGVPARAAVRMALAALASPGPQVTVATAILPVAWE